MRRLPRYRSAALSSSARCARPRLCLRCRPRLRTSTYPAPRPRRRCHCAKDEKTSRALTARSSSRPCTQRLRTLRTPRRGTNPSSRTASLPACHSRSISDTASQPRNRGCGRCCRLRSQRTPAEIDGIRRVPSRRTWARNPPRPPPDCPTWAWAPLPPFRRFSPFLPEISSQRLPIPILICRPRLCQPTSTTPSRRVVGRRPPCSPRGLTKV
mmetsp:Transcript_24590/g.61236  ORF Transcript_24590/g.61236 Transcript_24590/m.61236 type:complete len:212 (-) Transcript_24590:1472-2107(-)